MKLAVIIVAILAVALTISGFAVGYIIGSNRADVTTTSIHATAPTSTSTPSAPPLAVNAREIWDDYRENKTRASNKWRQRPLIVTLSAVSRIEENGRVRMLIPHRRGYEMVYDDASYYIELDFINNEDVFEIERGGHIVEAECYLRGLEPTWRLEFKDCKPVKSKH